MSKNATVIAQKIGPIMAKTWPKYGPNYVILHGHFLLTLPDYSVTRYTASKKKFSLNEVNLEWAKIVDPRSKPGLLEQN